MEAKCMDCGKEAIYKMNYNYYVQTCECGLDGLFLPPLDAGMKYIKYYKNEYARVASDSLIYKSWEEDHHIITENEVGKTKNGQSVYDVKWVNMETALETFMNKQANGELGDTKSVKEQLAEKELQLSEAKSQLMSYKSEVGQQVFERKALVAEMTKEMKEMEERGKAREEEILRESKVKINDLLETKNGVENKRKEAMRETEELKEALSNVNSRLEESEIICEFRKQQCLNAEALLAQKDIVFQNYKEKAKKELEEATIGYKEHVATLSANNATLQLAIREFTANRVSAALNKHNEQVGSEEKRENDVKAHGKMKTIGSDEMDNDIDA